MQCQLGHGTAHSQWTKRGGAIVLNKKKQNQYSSVLNVSLAKILQCIWHVMLRDHRPYDFILLRIIQSMLNVRFRNEFENF